MAASFSCSANLTTTKKNSDPIDPNQNKVSMQLTSGKTAEIYSSSTQKNIGKVGTFTLELVSSSHSTLVYKSVFTPRTNANATEKPTIKFKLPGPESMTTETTNEQLGGAVEDLVGDAATTVASSAYATSVENMIVSVSLKEFDLNTARTIRFTIEID